MPAVATERAALPETPQEITAAWLSSVLGAEVQAVSQTPLGDGQGFMGDILRLDLTTDDPGLPSALVAKLPKKANRVMGELLGVYEREIMFFRSFGGRLAIRIPQHFFSDFDRDKGSEKQAEILQAVDKLPRFFSKLIGWAGTAIAAAKKRRYLLLIEFFSDLQPGDQLLGLDAAGCRRVLAAIAPLHRQFWGSEELHQHFWLLPLDVDARIRQGMFRQHASAYAQRLGPALNGHIDWLLKHGETLMRRFTAEAPMTLLHGDLRLDNVIFDGDDCAFIDFQLVRRGPAAYDVAYFISSALQADADADAEEALLRDYHTRLGDADYAFDRFRRDYHRALMIVLAGLASTGEVDFANERGAAMMAAWLERLKARVLLVDPQHLL